MDLIAKILFNILTVFLWRLC